MTAPGGQSGSGIAERQMEHFRRVDPKLERGIAQRLGLKAEAESPDRMPA